MIRLSTLAALTLLTACTGPGAPEPAAPKPPEVAPETPAVADEATRALAETTKLLALVRTNDWAGLSAHVAPEGLRVSGSSMVSPERDTVLSAAVIAGAGTDRTVYRWGEHPGSGLPWESTAATLFGDTVAPFDAATTRTVNDRHDKSHSSNLPTVYAGHVWVDLHLPAGGDMPAWQSAVFVLRPEGDKLLWAGLVLDRWIP